MHKQPCLDAARCDWSTTALALRGSVFGKLPACLPACLLPCAASRRRDADGVRVSARPTSRRPGQMATPRGNDVGAKVQTAFAARGGSGSRRSGTGRAPGLADNSSLPARSPSRPRSSSPRRRSLMNQVKHPATGWRNLLICTRRSTSPAPCLARRSPACLTPGRQRGNKGAGEDGSDCPRNGGRQRLETKLIRRPPWV